jgi:hypothetical protein
VAPAQSRSSLCVLSAERITDNKINRSTVLVWAIIIIGTLVLILLLADQSFSNPTTEWECLFLKEPKRKNYQDGKDKEDD